MAELTFRHIYDGVTLALHNAYPDRRVHGGPVDQGLQPGDFNVVFPAPEHSWGLGDRFQRSALVDVIYYARAGTAECLEMADRLTVLLGEITTPEGDLLHGRVQDCNIIDGVLHVLARYDHFVFVPAEPTYMETLKINEEG